MIIENVLLFSLNSSIKVFSLKNENCDYVSTAFKSCVIVNNRNAFKLLDCFKKFHFNNQDKQKIIAVYVYQTYISNCKKKKKKKKKNAPLYLFDFIGRRLHYGHIFVDLLLTNGYFFSTKRRSPPNDNFSVVYRYVRKRAAKYSILS